MVRYLRTSIGNVLNQDYVLAATSMGLPGWKIFRAYVLPNSLSPLISLFGIEVGVLLTGVLVTETLFSWPGMGRITVLAIFSRDYPLVLGCTILAGIVVVLANFIADVVNALIDPRIRLPVGKR
jgi:peptide/nickel transport system permease protein